MKFLTEKDDLGEKEVQVESKFPWKQLENDDHNIEKTEVLCKNIDVPGTCFCTCCNGSIRYPTKGIKAYIYL